MILRRYVDRVLNQERIIMGKQLFSIALATLAISAPHAGLAQLTGSKASAPVSGDVFKLYGDVVQVTGQKATARSRMNPREQVKFDLPSNLQQQPQPGQPVWVNLTNTKARIVEFPIKPPKIKNCVGEGPGKGCFRMETSELVVSNNGRIAGQTHVISDDALAGFTGATWIRLFDRDGQEVVAPTRAGCWGVNMRQGRTEVWDFQIPAGAAVRIATVKVSHVNSPCDRDRWNDALDKASKTLEVAGKVLELYLASQGASGQ